jgi:Protein of unknown function (DUF1549)/Protein of unknown function (DUF1553)
MRTKWFLLPALIIASGLLVSAAGTDCSFLNNPDEYMPDVESRHAIRSRITDQVSMAAFDVVSVGSPLEPSAVPRKNFIDDAIFNRMAAAGIQSAPIASDGEFLRRVTLDLTGRIPSAADVDAFTADTNPSKRDLKIDALIGSPEFIDRWTMFFGDLLRNTPAGTNVNLGPEGRDTYYLYIKDAITRNKPYDQVARELISAAGDTLVTGQANWSVNNTIAMGPAQDTYDGQAVQLSSMFLGINVADCLLCHDGARHLDQVNLWGATQTRRNLWGLSAYFARTRMQRQVVSPGPPQVIKFIVSDLAAGDYNLNTTTGNRTARQPINGVRVITPGYPFQTSGPAIPGSGATSGETYRATIARLITNDLQFSRAAVNYVWEKFMVEAFVGPSNTFDLARLDPNNPPPAPWTLQPTNPALLDQMARWFQQNRYDLRALMALIAKSSAYQLSATYPGTWDIAYVPYYARKYVRRLDAEEIHDAIAKATGILGNYAIGGLPPVQWAMQLPDTRGPNGNAAVVQFLNAFGRGDRDSNPRRSDGSILQALNMMNNTFVMTRIHQNNAGSTVATLLAQTTDVQNIIRQLYLNSLSRQPRADEIAAVTPLFQQLGTRVGAESLQWMLLNKLDFIFNY